MSNDKAIRRALMIAKAPTEAQKQAGNYKKHHMSFQGLPISIENEKGQERSGKDHNGKPWSVKMPAHYGYIKRTEGADGDHVDAYVGPNEKSDHVLVINQKDHRTGKFDEHKVMLGFNDPKHAAETYVKGFSDGKGKARLGSAVRMTMEQFKNWLKNHDTTVPARAMHADGGEIDNSLGKRREEKHLKDTHGQLMSEISDRARSLMGAHAKAVEAGHFKGYEVGKRFLGRTGEGKPNPFEITGHHVRELKPKDRGIQSAYQRFGAMPSIISHEGKSYIPMVSTKSPEGNEGHAYLDLIKHAGYPAMGIKRAEGGRTALRGGGSPDGGDDGNGGMGDSGGGWGGGDSGGDSGGGDGGFGAGWGSDNSTGFGSDSSWNSSGADTFGSSDFGSGRSDSGGDSGGAGGFASDSGGDSGSSTVYGGGSHDQPYSQDTAMGAAQNENPFGLGSLSNFSAADRALQALQNAESGSSTFDKSQSNGPDTVTGFGPRQVGDLSTFNDISLYGQPTKDQSRMLPGNVESNYQAYRSPPGFDPTVRVADVPEIPSPVTAPYKGMSGGMGAVGIGQGNFNNVTGKFEQLANDPRMTGNIPGASAPTEVASIVGNSSDAGDIGGGNGVGAFNTQLNPLSYQTADTPVSTFSGPHSRGDSFKADTQVADATPTTDNNTIQNFPQPQAPSFKANEPAYQPLPKVQTPRSNANAQFPDTSGTQIGDTSGIYGADTVDTGLSSFGTGKGGGQGSTGSTAPGTQTAALVGNDPAYYWFNPLTGKTRPYSRYSGLPMDGLPPDQYSPVTGLPLATGGAAKNEYGEVDTNGRPVHPKIAEHFKHSKARDENGKLMRFLHGTRYNFSKFRNTSDAPSYQRLGHYFTTDPETATVFNSTNVHLKDDLSLKDNFNHDWPVYGSHHVPPEQQDRRRTIPAYLNFKNPYEVSGEEELAKIMKRHPHHNKDEHVDMLYHEMDRLAHQARQKGHDSMIVRNVPEYIKDGRYSVNDQYVAFHPNQIKSIMNPGENLESDEYKKGGSVIEHALSKARAFSRRTQSKQ